MRFPLDLFGSVSAGFAVSLINRGIRTHAGVSLAGDRRLLREIRLAAGLYRDRFIAVGVGVSVAGRLSQAMSLKRAFWRLLGKDPEAVVVSFLAGPEPLARAMLAGRSGRSFRTASTMRSTDLTVEGVTCSRPEEFAGAAQAEADRACADAAFRGRNIGLHRAAFRLRSRQGARVQRAGWSVITYGCRSAIASTFVS